MADVFLSYAREDRPKAEQIAQALTAGGYEVFWDVEIPPGATWADILAEKLASSQAAIVLWSKTSTASKWVREEARLALDKGKLIPVMLDESMPPFGFGEIQAANLAGWNGEADHPQWRLLLAGVARAVGAAPKGRAQAAPIRQETAGGWNRTPQAAAPAPAAPKKGMNPFVLIGGGVLAVVVLLGVIGSLSGGGSPSQSVPSGPGGSGSSVASFAPEAQAVVARAEQSAADGAAAMRTAGEYALKGQEAAQLAQSGGNGYGSSQGPMGVIAGDLVGAQSGREAPVGVAMAQGTQFFGVLQLTNAQGNMYSMNGTANIPGGGMASGKWEYSGSSFVFVGGGAIPGKFNLMAREEGAADGSGSRGLGKISYPNGETYLGEYRSVGEGMQSQVFRNGLGVHYDAKGGVIHAGRFNNDAPAGGS